MGCPLISSDMKECALHLWQSGWVRQDICTALCISQASLYRWAHILDEFSSVVWPHFLLQGCPRLIGLAAMTAIREMSSLQSSWYSGRNPPESGQFRGFRGMEF